MADPLKLFGLDRYDLKARLQPALFTLMPVLVLAAIWLPKVRTLIGGLLSLVVTCGATFLLSRIARYLGRRAQERWSDRLGPVSTTVALRHRDGLIDRVTKARYHSALGSGGFALPTASEEAADPAAADEVYRACGAWLREQTRDSKRFPLLAAENIDYGFRRNLLGMKAIAMPVLVAALGLDATAGWLQWGGFDETFWKALSLGAGLAAALATWIWIVDVAFVEDASKAYAVRLLAACENLRKAKGRTTA